ncbi:MAG TPA: alpha/beta fold hydrolase [Candidatus Limnocylindrales bacterium]|jgi:alpha-beta hydrolase superfamily lysophospholipase
MTFGLVAAGRLGGRRLARGSLALATGLAVGTVGLAWLAARSLVMPRRREPVRTPGDLGLPFSSLDMAGADDVNLAAWWIPADRPRGGIVLVHGFRSSRDEMLDHAPYLHDAGFDVLLYDARACGLSGGAMSTLGWRETSDLRAVIDHLEQWTDGRPLAVMGHSLGAAVAILEGADDPRVRAFILEAPFTAIEDVIDRGFRHFTRPSLPVFPFAPLTVRLAEARVGQHRSAVRPIDVIDRLAPRPALLVSGSEDPFVYPDDARRFAERAGPSCTLWLIPDAVHPGGEQDPYRSATTEYQARVLALLDGAVPARTARRRRPQAGRSVAAASAAGASAAPPDPATTTSRKAGSSVA